MTRLYLQIDDRIMGELMSALDCDRAVVIEQALTILNWAVKERQAGRVILSAAPNGDDVSRLAMHKLTQIEGP